MLQFDPQPHVPLPKGPIILAANHPSMIDPAIITTLTPAHVSILILDTLFKVPIFGRSLRWCGHIPVRKGNGLAALEQAAAVLEAQGTLAIFPEGVISPLAGLVQKPHTGIARLALRMGVPVIPIGISLDPTCIQRILTRVNGQVETGTWYFHGPYALTVGEPMRFSGDPNDRELVDRVGEQIMRRIGSLTAESSLRIQTAMSRSVLSSLPLRTLLYVFSHSLKILVGSRMV